MHRIMRRATRGRGPTKQIPSFDSARDFPALSSSLRPQSTWVDRDPAAALAILEPPVDSPSSPKSPPSPALEGEQTTAHALRVHAAMVARWNRYRARQNSELGPRSPYWECPDIRDDCPAIDFDAPPVPASDDDASDEEQPLLIW